MAGFYSAGHMYVTIGKLCNVVSKGRQREHVSHLLHLFLHHLLGDIYLGERKKKPRLDLLHVGSLEPVTIQFTLKQLQESTRQSECVFSLQFSSIYLQVPQVEPNGH